MHDVATSHKVGAPLFGGVFAPAWKAVDEMRYAPSRHEGVTIRNVSRTAETQVWVLFATLRFSFYIAIKETCLRGRYKIT